MDNQFLSQELSLELKNLGFADPCMAYYITKKLKYDIYPFGYNQKNNSVIHAPNYYQAFEWFRLSHNLCSWIYTSDNIKFWYTILYNGRIIKANEKHNSYPEAQLACINKLIDLVKK